MQVTQATNEQLRANEKIKPLRDKEIESAAKLNRINLEKSLDHEEERIKEEKRNLENVIQQIISDSERDSFNWKMLKKTLIYLMQEKISNNEEFQEINNETIDQLKSEKDTFESEISNLEQQIEQYNQIKNSKRDDWQDTLIKADLKSRQSTLKDVEGYDDPEKWTNIFKEKFYNDLGEISEKVDQASNISDEAKANYDRASNEAKNAATLSMELRENSDKKTLNKNKVIGHRISEIE